MTTEVSTRSGVCPEYQFLAEQCQKALAAWQQRRALIERASSVGKSAGMELERLQANCARANTLLENHEQNCGTCQYVSKIGGLDFESMSNALHYYKRSA
jgi:ribosomal protein S27AE